MSGTATMFLAAIILGLWLGAAVIWWRADDCGRVSAIEGKCLLWIDGNGINIAPVPETT